MRHVSSAFVLLLMVLLLIGAAPPSTTPSQCCETVEFVSCPKTYIGPDQVAFVENQMVIRFSDGAAFLTNAIYQDAEGIFITSRSKQNRPCYFWEWICPCCEACNGMTRQTCKYCGHGRDESPFDCDE